jgi:tRNA pseudouridine(55) synthase
MESFLQPTLESLASYGDVWWVSLLFILVRTIPVLVAPIPGIIVDIFGIATFGPLKGFILAEIGLVLGSSLAFLVGRFGRKILKRFNKLKQLEEWEKYIDPNQSIWVLAGARAISTPVFDYISYAAGLTSMSFWRFTLATLIGTTPLMLVIYFFGKEILERHLALVIFLTGGLIFVFALYVWARKKILMRQLGPDMILYDKPSGITSFDIIRILRRERWAKKIGHAGTLDPFATGLVILGRDKATKRLNHFLGMDKVYDVTIQLGKESDTGDTEGEIIKEQEVGEISKGIIEAVAHGLKGEIDLAVPKYSAIKVDGRRLYDYARKGEDVELPVKTMKIYWIKVLKIDNEKKEIECRIKVGSGTYIRSLSEEIGRRLKTIAYTTQLRRIQIGEYKIGWVKKKK